MISAATGLIGLAIVHRNAGRAGNELSVDAVGLGPLALEPGEGAHIGGMQAEDGQASTRQALGGGPLITARGLQGNDRSAIKIGGQLLDSGAAIGQGEGLAVRVDVNIELVHGDIDADKACHLWHASLSLACLTGSHQRPKQLFGLKGSRQGLAHNLGLKGPSGPTASCLPRGMAATVPLGNSMPQAEQTSGPVP